MEDYQQFEQEYPLELQQPQPESQSQVQLVGNDNPLKDEFESCKKEFSESIMQVVRGFMKYRQRKTYHLFVSDRTDYFQSMWVYLRKNLNKQSHSLEGQLLQALSIRQSNIHYDILEHQLQIAEHHRLKPFDYEEQQKSKKNHYLKEQQTQIHKKLNDINDDMLEIVQQSRTGGESRAHMIEFSEEKKKQFEEYVKKQKKEKQERHRLLEEQKKKEEELRKKKEEEDHQMREKQMKERKEELLRKIREKEEMRSKNKSEREERNKQYKIISKSMAQQPPLFKKIQQNYHSRYAKQQNQRRQKVMSERHSMFQIDYKGIEDHERKYEQIKAERDRQRKERMEQLQKMIQLQHEQINHKYKSHYDGRSTYVDPKEIERRIGLEKREKAKRYIQQTVKERYLPRIDQEKRREFLKMIEDLDKKKVKKIVRQDGAIEYQQIKPSDPRMVGLEYLQKTKEMAAKMRGRRRQSDQIAETPVEQPKIFDYLSQMRKKGTSMSHRDKYNFVNKKGATFDEKVKKVELQSEKLEELARQKEMKLKHGKFTTSEQILQHKEEIDQHYMDIINMKLKLINLKQE